MSIREGNEWLAVEYGNCLRNWLVSGCVCVGRVRVSVFKQDILIYHFIFHTVMRYGIIFLGNSCHNIQIFQMQKRVIRINTDCGNSNSCGILFKKQKILPLMSQYILSLLMFVVNRYQFLINSEIHNVNTRHSFNFHLVLENLDIYQKGVYYLRIKYLIIFLSTLKNFPVMRGHSNMLYNISYTWTPFIY
jgi:hypothetical protein